MQPSQSQFLEIIKWEGNKLHCFLPWASERSDHLIWEERTWFLDDSNHLHRNSFPSFPSPAIKTTVAGKCSQLKLIHVNSVSWSNNKMKLWAVNVLSACKIKDGAGFLYGSPTGKQLSSSVLSAATGRYIAVILLNKTVSQVDKPPLL